MELGLHILLVIRHIYFKFQANTLASFRNIQEHVKIREHFLSEFWASSVALTLSRHKENMGSVDNLVELNICVKFEENSSISIVFIEQTSQFWPLSVTLTLSRHKGNMVSAHKLVELNIWVKFEENSSISIGFIV